MKDIFISHSSLDQDTVEQIRSYFEQNGLSCWVSYRPSDLPPGEIYTEQITRAIDSSKIFVLVISNHSLRSEQVQQEAISANERQRFGLRIFPVVIDEQTDTELFHAKFGYVLSGKETICWNDVSAKAEMLANIMRHLGNIPAITEKVKLESLLPPAVPFVGRRNELTALASALDQGGRVWLSGVGGIGKTALLKAFCHENRSAFRNILYLPDDRCILRTIDNDEKLYFRYKPLQDARKTASDYEYAMRKLALLENSVTPDTLLILDDLASEDDPLLDRICKLNCKLVIASRQAAKAKNGFRNIIIQKITSQDDLQALFELYYGKELAEEDLPSFLQILSYVHGHTMSVVLLAKQLRYFGKRPCEYQTPYQLRQERVENIHEIIQSFSSDPEFSAEYIQFSDLLSISLLPASKKALLKTLCILPTDGIDSSLYIRLLGEPYLTAMHKLKGFGWIQGDEDSSLSLHPLIRDVVAHEAGLHLDDPGIKELFGSLIRSIENSWLRSYDENIKYKELALSFYYQFPSPTPERYKEYLILSKYLWIINCMDISLEIQNKVKGLFQTHKGKHANTPEEAETFLQIGFIFQGKGDYQSAAQELETAAAIYGNRYAAALSHLAQSYMMSGEKPLEAIEPLLQESLRIREQYWKDTVSEATSCHLYAKVLSAYEAKLEEALKLEQRSYRLFSALQPGSVNVSSASYMLGWLYVQTAHDKEDIQYGISRLLEARQIRLLSRGDPLHPWMEDIYLKLALSYEKICDFQEAKSYFELLLELRERKYADPFDSKILDVYRRLQSIYNKLDDTEKEKKCIKYLRYHE